MLGIDLMGPYPTTPRENKYIFTCTDFFTKWVEAFPIKSKNENCVGECLAKIFYRHGAPEKILSDQGREFVNKVSLSNNFVPIVFDL